MEKVRNKIFCIVGLSGTGKTTIFKEVMKLINIKNICSLTTRPQRPQERHGVDYFFINNNEFEKLDKKNKIIAGQDFNVANGQLWRYGFNKEDVDLLLKENNILIVCTPKGVSDFKNAGYDVVSILIEVDEAERMERIIGRKDNQGIAEIKRRNKADKLLFEGFEADWNVQNKDLAVAVQDVVNIIEYSK